MASILIADHDRDYRELVIFTLRFAGYIMYGASSGEECLALARQYVPDLILMEIDLPDKSFVVTYKELKSNKATGAIPVIFLIRQEEVKTFHAETEAWGKNLLVKSLPPDQLTKKVSQIIKLSHKHNSDS